MLQRTDIPRKLIVAVLNKSHILEITSTNSSNGIQFSGFEGRLLNLILTALGFGYDLRFPEDGQYGRKGPDGNWTGLIGMVQRGEADMAFCDISITEDRKKDVNFSDPYSTDDYLFVIEKPHNIKSNLAFLHPFTATVWMYLMIILVSITSVYFFIYSGKKSYGYILSCFCSSLFKQPLVICGGDLKWKGLASVWLLFALVISSSYSGTLLSFLMVPLQDKAIRNFEQLSAAVQKGTHRFFTGNGDTTVQYLKRSHERHIRLLGNAIEENGWYLNVSAKKNSYIDSTTAVIRIRKTAELFGFGNPQSRVIVSDEIFYSLPTAIAVRKGFCCMEKLN